MNLKYRYTKPQQTIFDTKKQISPGTIRTEADFYIYRLIIPYSLIVFLLPVLCYLDQRRNI